MEMPPRPRERRKLPDQGMGNHKGPLLRRGRSAVTLRPRGARPQCSAADLQGAAGDPRRARGGPDGRSAMLRSKRQASLYRRRVDRDAFPSEWAGARREVGLPSHSPGPRSGRARDGSIQGWSGRSGGASRTEDQQPSRKRTRSVALANSARTVTRAAAFSACDVSTVKLAANELRRSRSEAAAIKVRARAPSASRVTIRMRPRRTSRNSNWDVLPCVQEMAVQQKAMSTLMPKKRRECYCGNLAVGQVSAEILKTALNRLFFALPAFVTTYPDLLDAVRGIAFPPAAQGMFAFVEFHDEVLASTALQMSGFELCGRSVKVGRPMGFSNGAYVELQPLDVQPLRESGLLPLMPESPWVPGLGKFMVTNKLRELYFGNLLTGKVDEEVLTELLTPVATELPEYKPEWGPPVTKVEIGNGGTYAFVQLQTAELATRIVPIFDGLNLFGRKIRVGRPSNYHVSVNAMQVLPSLSQPAAAPVLEAAAPPLTQSNEDEPSKAFLSGIEAVKSLLL